MTSLIHQPFGHNCVEPYEGSFHHDHFYKSNIRLPSGIIVDAAGDVTWHVGDDCYDPITRLKYTNDEPSMDTIDFKEVYRVDVDDEEMTFGRLCPDDADFLYDYIQGLWESGRLE